MSNTKVRITLGEDSVELEGSEEFVAKHLDEFRTLLISRANAGPPPKVQARKRSAKVKVIRTSPDVGEATQEVKSRSRTKAKAKKVVAARFDIHGGDGKPSLKDFLDEKRPGRANGACIAVIGYYITEILGEQSFSEGQVEYAYKMLNIKRPNHLHQIMINTKNEKDYYEQVEGEESSWKLTRGGELFVADELPGQDA